jgi:hypothetical protein
MSITYKHYNESGIFLGDREVPCAIPSGVYEFPEVPPSGAEYFLGGIIIDILDPPETIEEERTGHKFYLVP